MYLITEYVKNSDYRVFFCLCWLTNATNHMTISSRFCSQTGTDVFKDHISDSHAKSIV